jgi:hypothetical protein
MDPFRSLERLQYFTGQLLGAESLQQEQEYFLARLRRHNRYLHGWGIVAGLSVGLENGDTVVVSPGLAIDCAGNEIVLSEPARVAIDALDPRQYVTIAYAEVGVDAIPSTQGEPFFSRTRESALLAVSASDPCANHGGMGPRTPGCGEPHPVRLASIVRRGARWRLGSAARSR